MSRSMLIRAVSSLSALCLLALVLILILPSGSDAETGGPVGGMTSPAGWIVEDGDNLTYSDETILLNGDLVIQPGGTLTFENVEMYSNARGDKNATIRILVEEGGTFIVQGSLLSSRYEVDEYQGNQPWRYKFHVYGALNMTASTVEYMWGDLEGIIIPDVAGSMHSTNTGGIEIWSDDVFIQGCTITRGQTCGMNIWEGSPRILDTAFVENDMMGLSILDGESAAVFRGCSFSSNGGRGVTLHANYLDFRDNDIHDNGGSGFFIINSQNVSFENLDISGNLRGLHVVLCDATFLNCSIVNNQVTMAVTNEGSVVLENCECDITGDDLDLHENCWVAYCVPVDVSVRDEDGVAVEGATVIMTGIEGNLTWTHTSRTDTKGMARSFPALIVRFNDWWHNLSLYSIEAQKGSRFSNMTENITEAVEVFLDLGGGDGGQDEDPSDVGGGDDDDEFHLPLALGVVVVLVVIGVILVFRRRTGELLDEEDIEVQDVEDVEGQYDEQGTDWEDH